MTYDDLRVVLFDGDCALCNATVRWAAKRDRSGRLHFASLTSQVARDVVAHSDADFEFDALPQAITLVDRRGIHTESTAALRIACSLRFPYPLLGLALLAPTTLRDAVYRVVARNRYRWLPRKTEAPPPSLAARILDDGTPFGDFGQR